ncbi:sugar MFS transporter [Schumannella sp. 10F1B-5-1]|uniref:MFS transporter n=1 Tax=Schumannella sp. 10F1B-5-1 TaxID=2590780 RepID=UPI001131624E|nr:MFS transporter [Schumannella sp. 10F1B-5-1]TPW78485.1 MFS transporter [Schumannella sp. 10F1B-5-1]
MSHSTPNADTPATAGAAGAAANTAPASSAAANAAPASGTAPGAASPAGTTPTASTRKPRVPAWRNAVFAIFAVNGFAMATWVARIPAVRDDLGIDPARVGILIAGLSAGAIVGLILSSHVLALLGGRRSLHIALVVQAIGLVIIGLGAEALASFPVAFAGLIVFGFSSSICDVGMNVEGSLVEHREKRTLLPLMHAAWSLGTVTGGAVAALVAQFDVVLSVHLSVAAVLVAIGGLVLPRFVPKHHENPTGEETKPTTMRDRLSIWLEPRTLLIGLILLGMAFAEGSANDWLALAMVDDRGLDHAEGAAMFTIFTVAMTIGRVGGTVAVNRIGRVPALIGSAVFAIVGLVTVILIDNPVTTIVGIVLWGIGASLGFPLGMSAAADDPAKAAARVSAVATVGYAAFLVGPPVIGIIGDSIGLLNALLVVVGLIAIAGFASPAARESGVRARAAKESTPKG